MCMYVCMCVCVYVCMYECMCVCVCVYVCMLCVYVCMYFRMSGASVYVRRVCEEECVRMNGESEFVRWTHTKNTCPGGASSCSQ